MPARDGTGPMGQGPATGRGRGGCKPIKKKMAKGSPQIGLGKGPCGGGRARGRMGLRGGIGFGSGFKQP